MACCGYRLARRASEWVLSDWAIICVRNCAEFREALLVRLDVLGEAVWITGNCEECAEFVSRISASVTLWPELGRRGAVRAVAATFAIPVLVTRIVASCAILKHCDT